MIELVMSGGERQYLGFWGLSAGLWVGHGSATASCPFLSAFLATWPTWQLG